MRAIEKKRPPIMNSKRWSVVMVLLIAAIIAVVIVYYNQVQQPKWDQKSIATATVLEKSDLVQIEAIHKHVWNEPYWIALGMKEDKSKHYAFLKEGEEEEVPVLLAADSLLTVEQMSEQLEKSKFEKVVHRMTLGIYSNQPVWEIYGSKDGRYYYSFFAADSGELINELQMLK